jgi:hypothetical protein
MYIPCINSIYPEQKSSGLEFKLSVERPADVAFPSSMKMRATRYLCNSTGAPALIERGYDNHNIHTHNHTHHHNHNNPLLTLLISSRTSLWTLHCFPSIVAAPKPNLTPKTRSQTQDGVYYPRWCSIRLLPQ